MTAHQPIPTAGLPSRPPNAERRTPAKSEASTDIVAGQSGRRACGPLHVLALVAAAHGGRGGIAQSTRDLLAALGAIPEVTSIQVLPRHVSEVGFETPHGLHQDAAIPGRVGFCAKALGLALKQKPDIVYCGHAFMAPLAQAIARLSGARVVTHLHGLEIWSPLSPLTRRSIAGSDLLLCVSRHTASKAATVLGASPEKCITVFNTVHERFCPGDRARARARFRIAPGVRVLTTVSRLDATQRHKGHDRVIPRLLELATRFPDLAYLIAGTGDDAARLASLADRLGASRHVRFLGHVPAQDLPDLYRASDLYVMPSHGEGFGISFVEAMACGTPALGLAEGGACDALCDGELGRAVTRVEFPNALEQALEDTGEDRDKLSRRTLDRFGRAQFNARIAAALTPVLAQRSRARGLLAP
jgi:phosphatidylinositol alpha-1,6-mannosyltransferase